MPTHWSFRPIDQGESLRGPLLHDLQSYFQTDLSDIRLHCLRDGTTANFTIGTHIFRAPVNYLRQHTSNSQLLAHEVAHCIQNRVGASSNDRNGADLCRLEAEASLAAVSYATGHKPPLLSPNTRYPVLRWGIVGHYYTVFFVAMAAGLDRVTAARLAFFAQMPDEVVELDACVAGEEIINGAARVEVATYTTVLAARALRGEIAGDRGGASAREIQTGLHCLTGGDSFAETAYRTYTLETINRALHWEYGLALHAFGDSFAHRRIGNPKVLYPPIYGHALDGHDPDNIALNPERQQLYTSYSLSMYGLLCRKFGTKGFLTDDDLRKTLSELSKMPEKASQLSAMRKKYPVPAAPFFYDDEKLLPWPAFRKLYARLVPEPFLMKEIGRRAITWSAGTRTVRGQVDQNMVTPKPKTMTA